MKEALLQPHPARVSVRSRSTFAHRTGIHAVGVIMFVFAACGDDGGSPATGSGITGASTTGDTMDTSGGPTTGEPTTATTSPSTTSDGTGDTDSGFIGRPDGGVGGGECDVWTQDCPEGEKCTPALVNNMVSTKCVPVVSNPGQPGDPCTRDNASGEDDCDVGVLCVPEVNPDLQRCFALCSGSPAMPICEGEKDVCVFADGGNTPICFPTCDPLIQDCGIIGWACFPSNGGYVCAPDTSGGANQLGQPCGPSLNSCTEGLLCAGNVANCDNLCCTPYCDLGAADPSASCPGAGDGEECVAVYPSPPPGFEDVGVCVIPA